MADPKLVALLKQGSEVWNRWREQQPKGLLIDLLGANLSGANLCYANLSGADLHDADLFGANLSHADLSGASLHDADLNNANLRGVVLDSSKLCHASLRHASLHHANLHHVDLSGADLRCALLGYTNLDVASLHHANLFDANLNRANLNRANLSGADLHYAHLIEVNLSYANLNHADLSHANLHDVNLSHANLGHTNLRGTHIQGAIFARIDLREVRGLTELNHYGPSHVALHTVQLPQDGSAVHFLRGCGVSDEWIDFYRAQMMSPIQYHSCFISYSNKDEILARRLHADLQDKGVRCWFAPHDMKIGDKIRSCIDKAIHLQDKLLLLLSEHALASNWVEDEVETALEKEQCQGHEVLFPIRLDDAVMYTNQPWAAKLRRTRHIGDFTKWADPQAYEQAFERLLRDLKA